MGASVQRILREIVIQRHWASASRTDKIIIAEKERKCFSDKLLLHTIRTLLE